MKEFRHKGYVIRRINYSEADKILTVFSYELGKIKVIAKGVRRANSKLKSLIEPYSELHIHVIKGKSFYILRSCSQLDSNMTATYDLEKISALSIITEIIDKLSAEEVENIQSYILYRECVNAIKTSENPAVVAHYFCVKFLDTIGSQPELDHDSIAERYYLNYESGKIESTRPNSHYGLIDEKVIKLWRLIRKNKIDNILKIKDISMIVKMANDLIYKYYQYHYHIQFKSVSVFQ